MKNMLMALLLALPLMGADILVVDDDNRYNNETRVYWALDNLGIDYDTFVCDTTMASPDSADMAPYKLVIWFTGDDGASIYFWNGNDTDNEEISAYLNGGGNMFVFGMDVFYDRYGSAADIFQVGDFVYDYLGISSYDSQAWSNDGNTGLTQLDQTDNVISGVDPILWGTTTGYITYADGCTPVDAGLSHYQMGPAGYALEGQSVVQSYTNDTFKVMTAWFNPYYFDSVANRDTWIGDVVQWFFSDTEAPTNFTLIEPANDSLLWVETETDEFDFEWNASTDPEGNDIEYVITIEDAGDHTEYYSEALTETHCTLTGSQLLEFIVDTTEVIWYVKASDGVFSTYSDTIAIALASAANQPPDPVCLISPEDGTGHLLVEMAEEGVEFLWSQTFDPNMNPLTYNIHIDADGIPVDSAMGLSDTSVVFSKTEINSWLDGENYLGISWYVMADDGEYSSSSDTFSVSFSMQDISILVVDDDNRYNNETMVYAALAANEYVYDSFDCDANGVSPTAEFMGDYDLVIWFAGDDGVGLYFWGAGDSLNVEISDFLDAGGRIWAFGMDVLYDKYGSAPDWFRAGDFMFDYFGTAAYQAQTYGNDMSLGVSYLINYSGSTVTALDTIGWGTSSGVLKWVDGVNLAGGAYPDLVMGGNDDYPLKNMPVSYHYITDSFVTMATWFNIYYMQSDSIRTAFVGDVVDWFDNLDDPSSLPATELLLPVEGTDIVLDDLSQEFLYGWANISYDTPVLYQLMINSDADNVYPLVKSTELDSIIIRADELMNLTGNGSDTLSMDWQVFVSASDNIASVTSVRTHLFIENINEIPDEFCLVTPANNDTLYLENSEPLIEFVWTKSIDPDNDNLEYELIIAAIGDTLYSVITSDTSALVPSEDLKVAMIGLIEVSAGWKVRVSDGEYVRESETNMIRLINNWTGIEDNIPTEFALYPNYPNPFNAETTIKFSIPHTMDVKLQVIDIRGRVCETLINRNMEAGYQSLYWNAERYASGVYFIRLKGDQQIHIQKMSLIK